MDPSTLSKLEVNLRTTWISRSYYEVFVQHFTSKDSQVWSLVLQIDSHKKQYSSIHMIGSYSDVKSRIISNTKLIIQEGTNEPTYTVDRVVRGEGLHQNMVTKIKFGNLLNKACRIVVLDHLDVYSYVDKDELDKHVDNKYLL